MPNTDAEGLKTSGQNLPETEGTEKTTNTSTFSKTPVKDIPRKEKEPADEKPSNGAKWKNKTSTEESVSTEKCSGKCTAKDNNTGVLVFLGAVAICALLLCGIMSLRVTSLNSTLDEEYGTIRNLVTANATLKDEIRNVVDQNNIYSGKLDAIRQIVDGTGVTNDSTVSQSTDTSSGSASVQ